MKYINAFRNLKSVKLRSKDINYESNWHLFYVLVDPENKNWILEALSAEGIGVNIHYSPLHINSYYNRVCEFDRNELKGSVQFFNRLIRLPMYPSLSDEQVDLVIKAVVKVLG